MDWNTTFRVLTDARIDYHDGRIILQLYRDQRSFIGQSGQLVKISKGMSVVDAANDIKN